MIDVIAKLDKSSRARLSWIQSFAASFGIVPKPIYGHITLAGLGGDIAACKAALTDQAAFTVDFTTVEVLTREKMVVAVAAKEGALAAIHERLVPGDENWIPHTVLLRDQMVDMSWVRMAMMEMFQPFTARVDRIEFMENGSVVDGIDLKGAQA